MADDPGQMEFAARLRRIEERRLADLEAQQPKGRRARKAQEKSYDLGPAPVARGDDVRLRNGIIWAGIFAVVGGAGFYGYKQMPEDYLASLMTMPSGDASGAGFSAASLSWSRSGSPQNRGPVREETTWGPSLNSPALMTIDGYENDVQAVAAHFTLMTDDTPPAAITTFARNSDCTLRRPAAHEKLVNIRMDDAALRAPVTAFSEGELGQAVFNYASAVTERMRLHDLTPYVAPEMRAVDIYLTDTSAPLYLLLQNNGDGTVWNLHPAPGVTIAHVASITPYTSGVAGGQADTTYEAIRFADFAYTSDGKWLPNEEGGCYPVPQRTRYDGWTDAVPDNEPERDAIQTQVAEEIAGISFRNDLTKRSEGINFVRPAGQTDWQPPTPEYVVYDAWFRTTLGVSADFNLISPRRAAHILAGPMPTTPIPHRPMAETTIHMMQDDYILAGTLETREAEVLTMKADLLLLAAGGDLANLDPAPMEVPTQ